MFRFVKKITEVEKMRYEVYTLGKHYLQVYTTKGFTLFANGVLDKNGVPQGYTDTLQRESGTWIIDCWEFLPEKYHKINPIYNAVFGFADDDDDVRVNATDLNPISVNGVNGQKVDVGNISLPENQFLPVKNNIDTSLFVLPVGEIRNFNSKNVEEFIDLYQRNSISSLSGSIIAPSGFSMKFGFNTINGFIASSSEGVTGVVAAYEFSGTKLSLFYKSLTISSVWEEEIIPLNNSSIRGLLMFNALIDNKLVVCRYNNDI